MIDPLGATIFGTRSALVAIDVTVKATALMILALACHGALGRKRVLARSALWNACLAGLLIMPLAALAFPRLRLDVLPVRSAAPSETAAPLPEVPTAVLAPPEEIHSFRSQRSGPRENLSPESDGLTQSPSERPPGARSAPRRARLSGIDLAVGTYLAVATLLLARLAFALAATGRLQRCSLPVDEAGWTEALNRWRARLGIRQAVSLLASSGVSVPVVIGCFRPAVLLPLSLVNARATHLIDAVLLHELGHVRRGDFGWNIARKLVQIAYWPHPLVWLVGRLVGAVREQACDDLCVHSLGGPITYRASLLAVASGLVRRPGAALGLAMARDTKLGRRLAWIDRTQGAPRCLLRWPVRLGILLTVTAVAGALGTVQLARATANAAPSQDAGEEERPGDPAAEQPPAIEITVRAKDTGKPLAGATVRASIDMGHSLQQTDRDGRLRIDLSRRRFRDSLSFDAWADGYVQQRHLFTQHDARYPKIPARVTIDLLPGEQTLGGKVIDEDGQPIAGVKVEIWGYLGEKKRKDELAYHVDATTDDRGQWRCRCFRDMQFAYLYLSHPDFLADGGSHARRHGRSLASQPPQPGEQPMEALRDFSDVQVMTRGVEIAGEVRDAHEKPVANAEVGWLEADHHDTFHGDMPTTKTDAAGRFRFPHVRPGRLVLQVKAAGHAPALKSVEAKEGAGPVVIPLERPRVLSGRVVNSQGKPIADVFVAIDTWRTYRALGVFLKTDAEGRFRWEDAPPDSLMVGASHPGFNSVSRQRVAPDEDVVVVLKRSLSISGRIRDAKTEKPIDDVEVEFGTLDPKANAIKWGRQSRVFAMQGHLQANVDVERTPEFRLRFRAKGYTPFESRPFRAGEGQVEYDVSLTPTDRPEGVAVAGVVRRPDGTPLAGAEVAVTYPMAGGRDRLPSVHIENGRLVVNASIPATKTDGAGRFQLRREPDPAGRYFAVVAVHPDYYAEVRRTEFEANTTIEARSWGRIEGVARLGRNPASGGLVRYFADRLGNADVPYVSDRGETKADARGHFVLERVVPGDVRVSREAGDGTGLRGWSNGTLVEVKAGETARADVGGTGRPVVAKIALPPGFDPNGDYAANSQFEIESDRPMIPYPKDLLAKRDGSMVTWAKRWWASPEGHEYRRMFFRLGQAKLQPDGTIRAEDVPSGEYRLTLLYSAEPLRGSYSAPERIARAIKQFTIPEIPGGRSDEPFDLGILRPRPREMLKIGQAAPAFDVETLNGGRVKLADFRGKYILVDFWATWCGPCLAEIPELKAVQERFADNERFAMLSLSLDSEKAAPRKLVADKGLAWTHGFLGDWEEGGVQDAYHVQAIPAIFLIGPDGTLKAQGLRGDAVEAAVAQALEKP